jgi:hypothetical protein
MKKGLILFIVAIITGCAPTQHHAQLSNPTDTVLTAGVGEEIYHLNKTRDMPNAFGNADVFGRKVDNGSEEVRYLGMSSPNTIRLSFRNVDIYSDETTIRGSGTSFSQSNTTSSGNVMGNISGNQFNATGYGRSTTTGVGFVAPDAHKAVMPGAEMQFTHNFKKEPIIRRGAVSIEVISATPSSIQYRLRSALQ